VKDAHDRYANLEVSYLLERMERFKGLAILATNRRGDLDDAFLRRLRYIVDFPVPDAAERRRIWASAIPSTVDTSSLDLDFLARQFQLTGGNIRSAVLNACLQAAARTSATPTGRRTRTARPALRMEDVVVAVKREHDKFQRAVGPAQFGAYATLVEATRA
jgi:SpoVK/Ycf46/Vps4 family AAA+-type ATPase